MLWLSNHSSERTTDTWEAIRQVPEGGVYACVRNRSDANALNELAAALPETMRPIVFTASVAQIPAMLTSLTPIALVRDLFLIPQIKR
ncbi:MAG TPA: hypothetical protein VE956_07120 [Nodularia sp. (in: cyanobacteria)]|nr:hypothetical protein [Nodularia sp. (in: cyanobacteria)]